MTHPGGCRFFLGGPGRKSTLVNPTYQLCILAQRYGMDLVPGTVIEQDDQGQYHNNAYYIDASGKVLLKYTKVHLWQHERKYLEPGNETTHTVTFPLTRGLFRGVYIWHSQESVWDRRRFMRMLGSRQPCGFSRNGPEWKGPVGDCPR